MKKNKFVNVLYLILLLLFLVACTDEDDDDEADIVLSTGSFGVKSYGSHFVIIKLAHKGGRDIYNAACDVQALKGSSIIDTGFAYFADGSTISSGQSTQDEAIFFDITSSSQYERIQYECEWLYR